MRKQKFNDDKPGIEFKREGKLVVRHNISWCGTPPITYGNFDGVWHLTDDSILIMKYKYWGGEKEDTLKLIALESNRLKLGFLGDRRIKK